MAPCVVAAVADHEVGGTILLPGVGYIEMALAASSAAGLILEGVTFIRPCAMNAPSASQSTAHAL